jgi:hypothetical protein
VEQSQVSINRDDTTWKQVQQMKEDDFDWLVVLSWKLGYSRKRKYGKDGGVYDDFSVQV